MRNLIYCLLILMMSSPLIGQEMDVKLKYEDGMVFLRWTPANSVAWEDANRTGYIVEKYENGVLVGTTDQAILPAPWSEKDSDFKVTMDVPATVIYSLIHIDLVDPEFIEESYPKSEYSEDRMREDRFTALKFYMNYDFHFIDIAGLGFLDKEVKPNTDYRYVVKHVGRDASDKRYSSSISFNSNSYALGELPKLDAEWTNRRSVLTWNSKNVKEDYWGFRMTITEDDGPEILQDSTPIVNIYDDSDDEEMHIIEKEILLKDNDIEYTFKVYAFDYFGGITEQYEQIKGKGRVGIGMSPTITESAQLKTNEVRLRWKLLDKFSKHVDKWHIYKSETYEGPYELDSTILDPAVRMAVRPIPYPTTYFLIAVEDDQGTELESFPQMVINLDTIPPAIPMNLVGDIDSAGIVSLSWSQNDERDFLGYKVFFANDTTDTWGLPHKGHLKEATYSDTINIRTIQEEIFFKITAVDRRNNRSPFSKILTLKRPDVLAPVEPNFTSAYSLPGKVDLRWDRSISEDVVKQSLYRREMREKGWKEIKTWTESIDAYFVDSLLIPNRKYVYLLRVTDDAGLMSEPSEPITGMALVDHSDFPINNFTVTSLSNKKTEISYNFPTDEIFEVWIYKKTEGAETRILRKLEPPKNSFTDQNIKEEESYSYFIQIVFNDGVKSEYSTTKTPSRL